MRAGADAITAAMTAIRRRMLRTRVRRHGAIVTRRDDRFGDARVQWLGGKQRAIDGKAGHQQPQHRTAHARTQREAATGGKAAGGKNLHVRQ